MKAEEGRMKKNHGVGGGGWGREGHLAGLVTRAQDSLDHEISTLGVALRYKKKKKKKKRTTVPNRMTALESPG